jgi:hypothetical protein
MSRYCPSEELLELAAQLADGGPEGAGIDALQQILASDSAAAEWFVEWMELNAMLELDLGNRGGVSLTSRPLLSSAVPGNQADGKVGPTDLTNHSQQSAGRRRSLQLSRTWLTLAASLVVGTTFLLGITAGWISGSSNGQRAAEGKRAVANASREIATIAAGVDVVFRDGYKLGARLTPGHLRVEHGVAQIVFDRGAVILLQGPAELELVDEGSCRLISGTLSADVVPDVNGFSVGAGDIEIYEHDARFGLRTGPQMATEVHAFGGGLELVGLRDGQLARRKLAEGEAIRWQTGSAATGIALDPDAFVSSQELARRQQASEQRAYQRWLDYSQRWLTDPAVVLRYEFGPSGDVACVNTVDPNTHPAKSRQSSPRWIAGRWRNKMSMLFDGRTDSLEAADHADLRMKGDFSLAIWMRLRSYSNKAWTRIVGKGAGADRNYGLWMNTQGSLLWQLCPDTDPENQETWDRYGLATSALPIDKWVCVVGVCAGDEFLIYVDGKLAGKSKRPPEIATSDDPLTIGFYADFPYHDEYFCGELDELILLKRALSEQEIREMVEAGQPTIGPNSVEESRDHDTAASHSAV